MKIKPELIGNAMVEEKAAFISKQVYRNSLLQNLNNFLPLL
jgi:hypothetical protein